MDDLFFHGCPTPPATEPAEAAKHVTAEVGTGIDEPKQQEEAGDGAEDNACNGTWLGTGIEALIGGRDGKDLGLPF